MLPRLLPIALSFSILGLNSAIGATTSSSPPSTTNSQPSLQNAMPQALTNDLYAVIYSFDEHNSEPQSLIAAKDGNFYGTTDYGVGGPGSGSVFELTPSGNRNVLYKFADAVDGMPNGARIISGADGNFYGFLPHGDPKGGINGSIFKLTPSGAKTNLYTFGTTSGDGITPQDLIQAADGDLYGITISGGAYNKGSVFRMHLSADKTTAQETVLYSFGGGGDGSQPQHLMQASDGHLYGVTTLDGANNAGTLFELTLSPDKTTAKETILYAFSMASDKSLPSPTALIQGADGNLYATTHFGGANNYGTLLQFTLSPDKTSAQETVLYSFGTTNADARMPTTLTQATDGNFYGITNMGGDSNMGTLFKVTLAGQETVLHSFSGGGFETKPYLIQATDGNLYGVYFKDMWRMQIT